LVWTSMQPTTNQQQLD